MARRPFFTETRIVESSASTWWERFEADEYFFDADRQAVEVRTSTWVEDLYADAKVGPRQRVSSRSIDCSDLEGEARAALARHLAGE